MQRIFTLIGSLLGIVALGFLLWGFVGAYLFSRTTPQQREQGVAQALHKNGTADVGGYSFTIDAVRRVLGSSVHGGKSSGPFIVIELTIKNISENESRLTDNAITLVLPAGIVRRNLEAEKAIEVTRVFPGTTNVEPFPAIQQPLLPGTSRTTIVAFELSKLVLTSSKQAPSAWNVKLGIADPARPYDFEFIPFQIPD